MGFNIKDFLSGLATKIKSTTDGANGEVPHHHVDSSALPDGAATQATLEALLAKVITAPSTEAKQDVANALLTAQAVYLDGLEALLGPLATQTTLAAVLAKLSADPATQTTAAAILAKLPTNAAPMQQTGGSVTEANSASSLTALQRLAPVTLGASTDLSFTSTSAQSGALTGTLVRLVAKSADCRALIATNPTALAASSLLVAGVEYYFAITSGHKVAAIRDASVDGTLNITVVG